jgi:HEAT repeat protein
MEILNLKSAGEFLSLHPEVLRKKAVAGEIPGKKIGFGKRSPWRFVKADLERYLSKTKYGDPPFLQPHIASLLHDLKTSDDLDKISNAIHLLGMEGFGEAVGLIEEHIDSPFEEIRIVAVRALMNILGAESKNLVYPLLDHDIDENTKIAIASFFNKIENDLKCAEILIAIFKSSKDDRVRHLAAYGLIESHPDLVLPFLRNDLTSGNSAFRYRAIMDLSKAHYKGIEDDLSLLIDDKIEKIRLKAIEVVGVRNMRQFIPGLIRIIQSDSSDKLKQAAGLAIARMHGLSQ